MRRRWLSVFLFFPFLFSFVATFFACSLLKRKRSHTIKPNIFIFLIHLNSDAAPRSQRAYFCPPPLGLCFLGCFYTLCFFSLVEFCGCYFLPSKIQGVAFINNFFLPWFPLSPSIPSLSPSLIWWFHFWFQINFEVLSFVFLLPSLPSLAW